LLHRYVGSILLRLAHGRPAVSAHAIRLREGHLKSVMKPLIGISCCSKLFGAYGMPNHAASDTYVRAVDLVVGGVPVLVPANGESADVDTLLSRLDGIILTGSRSNVQPSLYGGPAHAEGTPEDMMRDAVTMPLIRRALAAGVPVLAICRGLQELNVALGGTLHQRVQDLPGRLDHSTPLQANAKVRTGKAHMVRAVSGGWLHGLAGVPEFPVNSLHNQAIDRLAPGLAVEAVAPDETIEAVRVVATPAGKSVGFGIGVQWHPEYDFAEDALSRRIFESFGAAVHDRAAGSMGGLAAAAD
jgi:putative glutamine amidotransferase